MLVEHDEVELMLLHLGSMTVLMLHLVLKVVPGLQIAVHSDQLVLLDSVLLVLQVVGLD